ncbi:hypothetical protein KUTeg_003475 [Tegillarca granosa]|uniref:Secreted protein n=1 Tax=Tegillarca granosa TaxID=220873 RepID=A0ABQ9FM90_TEGGR|nr:hypothetical protein KUTeg_003475 [Tegillarca granosa]
MLQVRLQIHIWGLSGHFLASILMNSGQHRQQQQYIPDDLCIDSGYWQNQLCNEYWPVRYEALTKREFASTLIL